METNKDWQAIAEYHRKAAAKLAVELNDAREYGARMQRERDDARDMAVNLHWMARRYADGRQSYAVGMFNEITRRLLAAEVRLYQTGDGTVWARDGGGRAYDGLTDAEAATGSEPDWMHDETQRRYEGLQADLTALRAVADEMEAALKDFEGMMSESSGIAGYHLNGDVYGWDEGDDPLRDKTCSALTRYADLKKETRK